MKIGIYLNNKYFTEENSYIGKIEDAFKTRCVHVKSSSDLDGLNVLFVLGGDGTILSLAAECAKRSVKIIGINYGHVGFLAEFEPNKLDEAIALVASGNYSTQSRSMLEITCGNQQFIALNELVIQRHTSGCDFSNTVCVHAEIDGSTVDNFSSDGIIVSTPTGSTAYSLAAGGSVLTPDLNAFILTPVCAHSLHSRPVVFSDSAELTLSPVNASAPLALVVDGKPAGKVCNGEKVIVKKSAYTVDFITKEDKNFFNKLLVKLNKWSK